MACNHCEYKKICVQKCKKDLGFDPLEEDNMDMELEKNLLDRCELKDKKAIADIKKFYLNKKKLNDEKFDEFDWDIYR